MKYCSGVPGHFSANDPGEEHDFELYEDVHPHISFAVCRNCGLAMPVWDGPVRRSAIKFLQDAIVRFCKIWKISETSRILGWYRLNSKNRQVPLNSAEPDCRWVPVIGGPESDIRPSDPGWIKVLDRQRKPLLGVNE